MKNLILITILSLIAIGCAVEAEIESNDDTPTVVSQPAIKGQPLDGIVHGQAWTFITGRVKKSKFDNSVSFSFWNEDIGNICDSFTFGSDYQLMGKFPLEVGTHSFGNMNNINFAYSNSNLIATTGTMIITEITDDKVFGKMVTSFDGDNTVNGEFELTYCK